MAAQVLRFPNFAMDRWQRLKASMAQHGIDIGDADSGEFRKFGADVSYAYAQNELTLVVHHAPMFHSLDGFTSEIKKAVDSQA